MSTLPTYIVACFSAFGGTVGYIKAGSTVSLVAGIAYGLVLAYAASQMANPPSARFGATISVGSSILVGSVMLFRFLNSGKFMPAGLMSLLALALAVYNAPRLSS